jgi:hypothetical protein
VQFLAGCLAQGPRNSRDIWAEAQKQGVTEGGLRRARNELEVRSVRVWASGQRLSYWLLPGQQLPESVAADDSVPGLPFPSSGQAVRKVRPAEVTIPGRFPPVLVG